MRMRPHGTPRLTLYVAAPANHEVLFENENLRVLEVFWRRTRKRPTHHHRWRSVFVLDQVQGPIHDIAPDGTQLPPSRDVIKALQAWDGQGCLVVDMANLNLLDVSSTLQASPFTASGLR